MIFVGWSFGETVEACGRLLTLRDATPPRASILNHEDIHDFLTDRDGAWRRLPNPNPGPMPTPRLAITEPNFAPNFMHFGLLFVSACLRDAMNLSSAEVRYLDVDARASTPEAQAQDYKVMDLLHKIDPFDWEKMDWEWWDTVSPDGTQGRMRQPKRGARRRFRDDLVPASQLFIATNTAYIIATDALAARVLEAGITDVMFQDITGDEAFRNDSIVVKSL